ncbi:PREDICTED: pentatricopeptide repeat-containing protein At1g59720, chloroplastic/mitochondrial [Tarenaya hassleriana]|uniref:pentatricopeptide repeat-containing protein At1g59720, chloroplastic/mitochondrial n=1 Tax=Tarenaya hassleriana TaxID=28532 RepID=UPI00053C116F|nr:PREDICTED: pentatricopeptide repeat-containing protein At1g59720, chloroplastic/mitochondrial [Tarenaya hassleriana]XP_010548342.1 PREDICTED: pentatricopeptide repeat-containing protein At1g59720, chloroplastic/mitochondrial [Tarenaya hassleriana]XP_010548350.1 PREDICTED: pentatricopeptide repeat-containing protein At1g59720, chloroplastic/mitochondrial [Tarenaya hassleriana]XP_010548358.1 PREDICTED: pentatricopeptide repeat-containing protein At1g59720, chloroplastic/mitochondrial [Tarenaya 
MSMALAPTLTSPHLRPTSSAAGVHHHGRILSLLEQCTDISCLKQLHAFTLRTTFPRNHATLFLYGKILHLSSFSFSDLNYAFRVFNTIEKPSSFMWNTLIRACAHDVARKEEALLLYKTMLETGDTGPDKHTFPFVLKACAYVFGLPEGKQVHCQILKHGLSSDVYVNNGLIHLYGSCGCLDLARKVFDEMPERSAVTWNAMIDALVRVGEYDSALELFRQMQRTFEPDGYTMQSVLSACAGLGSLPLGIWAHAFLLRKCDVDAGMDVLIKNSLIDMYCKCGSAKMAEQVFQGMLKCDVATWNSMILGFAMHGKAEEALDCFTRMVKGGDLRPNAVTFVGVLSACNHRGMVKEGREYFDAMVRDYNIKPVLEHYGCIVDLSARAGFITEALDLVKNMPMKPDAVVWRSLLDACSKKGGTVELSEKIARRIIGTGEENESINSGYSGGYVLLSRVYASASRWNEVGIVRKLMTDQGITKEPGCSSIEINGISHEFFAGDTSHPETEQIYKQLNVIEEKLKSVGYSPDQSQAPLVDVCNDDDDDSKENSLRLHSERLAIAFGLINSKPGAPIRVFKNLRVCSDCHEVTKLISGVFETEIIVRDRVRFHHFKDGSCSCSDYW